MSIPKTIYLQVGMDVDLNFEDFDDLDEVTWCTDKIHDTDIEYILTAEVAGVHDKLREETKDEVDMKDQNSEPKLIKISEGLFTYSHLERNPEIEDHIKSFLDDCERSDNIIKSLKQQLKEANELGKSKIPCCECGGSVIEFSVPNRLWNIVMRPDGHETNKEYLCFACWNNRLYKFIASIQAHQERIEKW